MSLVTSIFGTYSDKQVAKLTPIVNKIEALADKYSAMTDDELKVLFAEYGEVASARVVTNRSNGKSKGFGFVVMPNRNEAEKAIAAYSEKDYMGRKMRVNEAKNTITE